MNLKHTFVAFVLLTSILFAKAPSKGPATELGDKWIASPASKSTPGFRYQIADQNQSLHYHVLLDQGADPKAWALQVGIADPRVVRLRKSLLADSKASFKEYKSLLKDSEHQSEECQKNIKEILESVEVAQSQIQDYDPRTYPNFCV